MPLGKQSQDDRSPHSGRRGVGMDLHGRFLWRLTYERRFGPEEDHLDQRGMSTQVHARWTYALPWRDIYL